MLLPAVMYVVRMVRDW